MNTRRLLRELHRGFASEISSVNKLVTLMVLPLAAILISSLLLYPRFYRGLLRFPRRGTRLRAQLSDLHRLVGSWCVMFLMVLVMTSAQFMIESIGLGPNFYPSYAKKVSGDEPLMKEGFSGADLDMLVTLAQETYPGLDVSDIVLPSRPGEPLAIRGQLTSKLVRPSANSVNIDPFTFEVRGAYRAETSGNGLWIFEAMRVIHYGSFAGLTSRVLWVIFGLGLSLLAALGALIYAERLVFQSERSKRFPRRSRLEYVWVGMGIGKWAGLIAIAGALWWTID